MPKYWNEGDSGYHQVKCPAGHDEIELQKREILPDRQTLAHFQCNICKVEFTEQGIYIFSNKSIGYEPPGVSSGKEVKRLVDYEKRKRALRRDNFA